MNVTRRLRNVEKLLEKGSVHPALAAYGKLSDEMKDAGINRAPWQKRIDKILLNMLVKLGQEPRNYSIY